MTHRTGLNPPLLRLFAPQPPMKYIPPPERKPYKLPMKRTSLVELVKFFEDSAQNPGPGEYVAKEFKNPEMSLQARVNVQTVRERDRSKRTRRDTENRDKLTKAIDAWDPNKDPQVEGDPFKTLFVASLPYTITEEQLRKEFEEFGPIRRVVLVSDVMTSKPRGYAFLEYEHQNDMKEAFKRADGRLIGGRRCVVDVERGRTVEGWKPRRLGGGLGGAKRAAKKEGQDGLRERDADRMRERARVRLERERERAAASGRPLPPLPTPGSDRPSGRDRDRDRDADCGDRFRGPERPDRGLPRDRYPPRDRDDRGPPRDDYRGRDREDRGPPRDDYRGRDRGYDRGGYDRGGYDRGRDGGDRKRRDRDGYDGGRDYKRPREDGEL